MERFGQNFKGNKKETQCILCEKHQDGQSESFSCPVILNEINIEGNYENLFEDIENYPELITTITNINNIRQRMHCGK